MVGELGYADRSAAAWISEREAAIAQLRELCGAFGDNEWDARCTSLTLFRSISGGRYGRRPSRRRLARVRGGVVVLRPDAASIAWVTCSTVRCRKALVVRSAFGFDQVLLGFEEMLHGFAHNAGLLQIGGGLGEMVQGAGDVVAGHTVQCN